MTTRSKLMHANALHLVAIGGGGGAGQVVYICNTTTYEPVRRSSWCS